MRNKNITKLLHLLLLTLFTAIIFSSCGVLSQVGKDKDPERVAKSRHELLLVASADGLVNSYAFNPTALTTEHSGSFSTKAPASIVLNRTDNVLYIANNLSSNATVTATKFNKSSGELVSLNQASVKGQGPVAIDIFDDRLISANEIDGSITLFHLDKINGQLYEADWRIDLGEGKISNPTDVTFTKDGAHLYVVDKGQDKVFHFRSHGTTPPLTIDNQNIILPKGSKPIELVFDNTGRDGYLLCEDDSNIYHFRYDDGNLELLGKYDTDKSIGTKGTAIAINPNGQYVYATHSGRTNGITVFSRDISSGVLSKLQTQKTGLHPSKIRLSPDGKLIAIAAEGDDEVRIYRFNPSTGLMTTAGTTIKLHKPVDIIWKAFY